MTAVAPAAGTTNHGVEIGTFLMSSWGYDQTNIDYYEVVGVTKSSVRIREVAQAVVGSTGYADEVVPVAGEFIGPVMTKRVKGEGPNAAVRIASYAHAWVWDGRPRSRTASGWGH